LKIFRGLSFFGSRFCRPFGRFHCMLRFFRSRLRCDVQEGAAPGGIWRRKRIFIYVSTDGVYLAGRRRVGVFAVTSANRPTARTRPSR